MGASKVELEEAVFCDAALKDECSDGVDGGLPESSLISGVGAFAVFPVDGAAPCSTSIRLSKFAAQANLMLSGAQE